MRVLSVFAILVVAAGSGPDFSTHFVVERKSAAAIRVWGSRSNFAASHDGRFLWWAENGPPAPSLKELNLDRGGVRTVRDGFFAERLLTVPKRGNEILALHKVGIGARLTGYTLGVVSTVTGEERSLKLEGSTSDGGIVFSPDGEALVTGVDFECDSMGRCDPGRFLVVRLESGRVEGEIGKQVLGPSHGGAPAEILRRRALWLDNNSIEIQQESDRDRWTTSVVNQKVKGKWRKVGPGISTPEGGVSVAETTEGGFLWLRAKSGRYIYLTSADIFGGEGESVLAVPAGDRIVFLAISNPDKSGWQLLDWKVARWR